VSAAALIRRQPVAAANTPSQTVRRPAAGHRRPGGIGLPLYPDVPQQFAGNVVLLTILLVA
jgi:hypothetical protein